MSDSDMDAAPVRRRPPDVALEEVVEALREEVLSLRSQLSELQAPDAGDLAGAAPR